MRINVIVHPNSKKTRIEKDILGQINVYVSTLPIDGRANEATVKALSAYFKVKKNAVTLISGQKARLKLFEIEV